MQLPSVDLFSIKFNQKLYVAQFFLAIGFRSGKSLSQLNSQLDIGPITDKKNRFSGERLWRRRLIYQLFLSVGFPKSLTFYVINGFMVGLRESKPITDKPSACRVVDSGTSLFSGQKVAAYGINLRE